MPTQRILRLDDFIIKHKGCLHIGKMGDNGHGLLYDMSLFWEVSATHHPKRG